MLRSRLAAGLLTGALILTGCSVSVSAEPSATPADITTPPVEPSPETSVTSSAEPAADNAVPGYAIGQAPPVPLFSLPDISRVSTAGKKLRDKLKVEIKDIPGVTITAVRCTKDGQYNNADSGLVLYGDGSGSYVGPDGSYTRGRDGSETSVSDRESITRDGKGGGSYVSDQVSITNAGDGSGSYVDSDISVTIDKDNIRPDAAATLDTVATALKQVGNNPIQISGHTDAIGTDSYNQGLSERRAGSVEQALRQRGVAAPMTSKGYGESRPVAPNELNGTDNPAGRQLNRRVEIFVRS